MRLARNGWNGAGAKEAHCLPRGLDGSRCVGPGAIGKVSRKCWRSRFSKKISSNRWGELASGQECSHSGEAPSQGRGERLCGARQIRGASVAEEKSHGDMDEIEREFENRTNHELSAKRG